MTRGIKYIAALPPGGYAEAAKRAMLGLAQTGVPLTFQPLVEGRAWGMNLEPWRGATVADRELAPWCNRAVEYDTVIVHAPPELLPAVRAAEPGKRIVGLTVWETDRLLPHWLPWLEAADQIIVPCGWNRTVFAACGVRRPIAVVPHIALGSCASSSPDRPPEWKGQTIFYNIGAWTGRKRLSALVRAYLATFTRDDPVVLVLKTGRRNLTRQRPWIFPRTSQGTVNLLRCRRPRSPEIRVETGVWSEEQVAALHRSADCYVAAPHAEGWGLGSFDAAAAGRPVITTGYGGPLEYLGADYPLLIKHRLGPARGEGFESELFLPDQNWALPDDADLRQKMRWVFEHRAEAAQLGATLSSRMREKFGSAAMTAELLRALECA